MKITFYKETEYRKYIRSLPPNTEFRTLTKPYEFPIILYVPFK